MDMKKILAGVAGVMGILVLGAQAASANCDPTIQACFGTRTTTTTVAPTTTTPAPTTTTPAPTTTEAPTTTALPIVEPVTVTTPPEVSRPAVRPATDRPRTTTTTQQRPVATTTTLETGEVGAFGERETANEGVCQPIGEQDPGNPWIPYLLGCGSGALLVAAAKRRKTDEEELAVA